MSSQKKEQLINLHISKTHPNFDDVTNTIKQLSSFDFVQTCTHNFGFSLNINPNLCPEDIKTEVNLKIAKCINLSEKFDIIQ